VNLTRGMLRRGGRDAGLAPGLEAITASATGARTEAL
jgi:hypothetical protein